MTRAQLVKVAKARALARTGAARSVRLAAGLSLAEVAQTVGCSPVAVLRWETGQRTPRPALALRYGRLLEELMGRSA